MQKKLVVVVVVKLEIEIDNKLHIFVLETAWDRTDNSKGFSDRILISGYPRELRCYRLAYLIFRYPVRKKMSAAWH